MYSGCWELGAPRCALTLVFSPWKSYPFCSVGRPSCVLRVNDAAVSPPTTKAYHSAQWGPWHNKRVQAPPMRPSCVLRVNDATASPPPHRHTTLGSGTRATHNSL